MLSLNRSVDCLRLAKSPSMRTTALFVGIISLGIGAAYYGSDNLFLKAGYIIGCVVIGLSFLEEWESCVIDKNSQTIALNRSNVYQKFLRLRRSRDLRFAIDKVMSVRVVVSKSRIDGGSTTRRRVLFLLTSGISLPLLEGDDVTFSQTECDLLADNVRTFLDLNHVQLVDSDDLIRCRYYGNRDDGSSSDDVEFEPLANNGRPRETITLIGDAR